MINDIIQTIDEIVEFLENCSMQGWADKYAAWRQEIIENKEHPKKLKRIYKQLYVASAPRGFLGDYPIYSAIKGKFKYEDIAKRQKALVEKMITQLKKEGITI